MNRVLLMQSKKAPGFSFLGHLLCLLNLGLHDLLLCLFVGQHLLYALLLFNQKGTNNSLPYAASASGTSVRPRYGSLSLGNASHLSWASCCYLEIKRKNTNKRKTQTKQ
eukprot:GHVT01094419.1.p2 GENE.GHVT01094419.1~~GHVT01094419.1.p2  ORF type:complete len:109 (-),score=10.28 GHVT01094419.1:1863-2189(-)